MYLENLLITQQIPVPSSLQHSPSQSPRSSKAPVVDASLMRAIERAKTQLNYIHF